MCWWIRCVDVRRRGRGSESTYETFQRNNGQRRKLLIRMTTPPGIANVRTDRKSGRLWRERQEEACPCRCRTGQALLLVLSKGAHFNPGRRSTRARVAARLQAARRCNRSASYQCANDETAPCDENDPACARTPPQPLTPVAKAPTTDPCLTPATLHARHAPAKVNTRVLFPRMRLQCVLAVRFQELNQLEAFLIGKTRTRRRGGVCPHRQTVPAITIRPIAVAFLVPAKAGDNAITIALV